jgi:hypothetical protein
MKGPSCPSRRTPMRVIVVLDLGALLLGAVVLFAVARAFSK